MLQGPGLQSWQRQWDQWWTHCHTWGLGAGLGDSVSAGTGAPSGSGNSNAAAASASSDGTGEDTWRKTPGHVLWQTYELLQETTMVGEMCPNQKKIWLNQKEVSVELLMGNGIQIKDRYRRRTVNQEQKSGPWFGTHVFRVPDVMSSVTRTVHLLPLTVDFQESKNLTMLGCCRVFNISTSSLNRWRSTLFRRWVCKHINQYTDQ